MPQENERPEEEPQPDPQQVAPNERISVCSICLDSPVANIVLVPCGHAQFCEPCLEASHRGAMEVYLANPQDWTEEELNGAPLQQQERCPTCRAHVTRMRFFQ